MRNTIKMSDERETRERKRECGSIGTNKSFFSFCFSFIGELNQTRRWLGGFVWDIRLKWRFCPRWFTFNYEFDTFDRGFSKRRRICSYVLRRPFELGGPRQSDSSPIWWGPSKCLWSKHVVLIRQWITTLGLRMLISDWPNSGSDFFRGPQVRLPSDRGSTARVSSK